MPLKTIIHNAKSIAAAILTGCILLNTAVHATEIKDIRIGQHPDKKRIVIEIDAPVDYRTFSIDNPDRIIIDLPNLTKHDAIQNTETTNTGINDIRYGNLGAGLSRLVFEMNQPAIIKTAFLIPKRDGTPDRLVIDYALTNAATAKKTANKIIGTMPTTKSTNAQAAIDNMAGSLGTLVIKSTPTTNKPQKDNDSAGTEKSIKQASSPPVISYDEDLTLSTPQKNTSSKPLIIIDPGHGGPDPGAKGANGIYEKNITLAVGKKLKKILEDSGHYRVKMTRETDIFIPLRDRVRFARRHGGDLFISIHADSISKSTVSGASVYTLSEKASDAETAKLAARENSADLIGGIDLSDQDADVANILLDLTTRDTMNQSKFMANTVVNKLNQHQVKTLGERPHRSAGFAVLKATDIPSILVEMGYVTNLQEANKLSSAAYQQQIAQALRTSVDNFFAKIATYSQE